jgi:hypothetical protein
MILAGYTTHVYWRPARMQTVKFVHWAQDGGWIGYLEDYPDYWTQGETLEDLMEHLKDLYLDIASGDIKGIRKVGELTLP